MELPEGTVPAGLGALAAAALTGFWGWLTKRQEVRASPPAAMASADAEVATALSVFVDKLGQSWGAHTAQLRASFAEQIGELRGQLAEVRGEQEAEKAHRVKCEAELAEIRRLMDAGGQRPLPFYPIGRQPGDPTPADIPADPGI